MPEGLTTAWFVAAVVYALVFSSYGAGASGRDFRVACGSLAIVGLAGAYILPDHRLHLLWYVPVSIIAAQFYASRRLLALSRRLNEIGHEGHTDVESMRRSIESAVRDYNEGVEDDEDRLK